MIHGHHNGLVDERRPPLAGLIGRGNPSMPLTEVAGELTGPKPAERIRVRTGSLLRVDFVQIEPPPEAQACEKQGAPRRKTR